MINVDKKSTKNVKMKRIVKKKFLKEKKNFNTMMFDVIDVKNSNIMILIKYYIDDTIKISNNFTKFFFEFKNFSEEENATQTQKKEQKKKEKFEKEREQELRKSKKKRQMNEFLSLFDIYIN